MFWGNVRQLAQMFFLIDFLAILASFRFMRLRFSATRNFFVVFAGVFSVIG